MSRLMIIDYARAGNYGERTNIFFLTTLLFQNHLSWFTRGVDQPFSVSILLITIYLHIFYIMSAFSSICTLLKNLDLCPKKIEEKNGEEIEKKKKNEKN